jgi:hypothetical protein
MGVERQPKADEGNVICRSEPTTLLDRKKVNNKKSSVVRHVIQQ